LNPPPKKSLVNYITARNQQVYYKNLEKIKDKPYAKYFHKDMYVLDEEIKKAQSGAIPVEQAIKPTPSELNKLLESGYLNAETGYCKLDDGTFYSSSITYFPNCTAEMFHWWFWWHSVEPERYALWYPYCHVSVEAKNKAVLSEPGLTHEQRYVGNTHILTEYLNDRKNKIEITFLDPAKLGFDTSRFKESKIVASACGIVTLQNQKVEFCTMVHLARETENGLELRSRYYIGHNMHFHLFGMRLGINKKLSNFILKKQGISIQTAYEQVMHDQIEFTHLASILPDLYKEFGSDKKQ
jgi:2,4-diacetylphloroglucinol hydrolase